MLTLMVKRTVPPVSGVGLLTLLLIARSVPMIEIGALALLLPLLGSGWAAAVRVAVLMMVVWAVPLSTVAVMVSALLAFKARLPALHNPVL